MPGKPASTPAGNLATNRRASHDYHILERIEAGLALSGAEVKSVKAGRVSLQEGYAEISSGQAWLHGLHIQPYEHSRQPDYLPARKRLLLLHRHEIDQLVGQTTRKGFTVIPTRVYLKNGWIKVELAVARGKQAEDKREDLKRKEANRETARAVAAARRR